ncbi:glycosyltransferase family 2 protein [Paenibacillus sp. YIM B09110]|uniref:glycosyltransferase family 2 protein n=1 Tax=Paenibacillus sp. YIM B09110 TaxID=3126102 RepID=UPI00301BF7B7
MNVSIVIPNYNGENYILDSIASIYDQIANKSSIIVIDNHSSDSSLALIQVKYPDITLIVNSENIGFAAAVNQGIKASDTTYVILLNNDAFAREGYVLELLKCIDSDPNIFSVSSKMLRFSEPGIIDNAGDELTILGWAYKTGDGSSSEGYYKQRTVFSACAGAAIYRRETFNQIGYFDESFFAYLEDVDIGFRANLHGYKNVFCPSAEVEHIGSATSGSKYNDFKVKISARNNVWLLAKNLPFAFMIVNFGFILMGFLIKGLFFMVNGFGMSYFNGIIEGLRGLSKMTRTKPKTRTFKYMIRNEIMMIKSTGDYMGSKMFGRKQDNLTSERKQDGRSL